MGDVGIVRGVVGRECLGEEGGLGILGINESLYLEGNGAARSEKYCVLGVHKRIGVLGADNLIGVVGAVAENLIGEFGGSGIVGIKQL